MRKVLYIIAAGISSRMNGIPKHLCKIGDKSNLTQILEKSENCFEKRYVVINEKLDSEYIEETKSICSLFSDTEIITIESGKGDLHAIIEALITVRSFNDDAFVIWGDAVFVSSKIFEFMTSLKYELGRKTPIGVFVKSEQNPYAYIISNDRKNILSAGFNSDASADKYKNIDVWHDMCAFRINIKALLYTYSLYEAYIDSKLESLKDITRLKNIEFEYSVIRFLNTLPQLTKSWNNIIIPTMYNVYTFNNEQELDEINNMIL